MDVTVELRDVTKLFGDVKAVDRVSFEAHSGEFFSLLGPSGCGKTTTLRLIAGFEAPTQGQVLIRGDDVTDKRPYQRNVNTVFQSYALFPHLTVAKNIAFGLERKKTPRSQIRERVDEVLGLVRLEEMGSRYPRHLSGGQQQRVALARALVLRPEVLLLDEPLGALDLKLRKAMQLELKSLQERVGITFIYVTHDQEEALTMSDHIAVMERGRLIQTGSPEDIYNLPRTRFVAEFIGNTNLFDGRITEVGEGRIWVETGGGLRAVLPAKGDQVVGRSVSFSIRPEKILMTGAGEEPGAANQFPGRITNRIFLGSSVSYEVALAGGEKVSVDTKSEPSSGRSDAYSPGHVVTVSWDPGYCVILVD